MWLFLQACQAGLGVWGHTRGHLHQMQGKKPHKIYHSPTDFSPHSPDTSTNPSLVLTLSSSGLKLCTFTHTFQGSPPVVTGELLEEGSPYLPPYSAGPPVDWRAGKPARNPPPKGEGLRRVLSRPGRAQPGQSIARSSRKAGIPKSSSMKRDASWSLNGDWSMNGDSPNGSLGNLCRLPMV